MCSRLTCYDRRIQWNETEDFWVGSVDCTTRVWLSYAFLQMWILWPSRCYPLVIPDYWLCWLELIGHGSPSTSAGLQVSHSWCRILALPIDVFVLYKRQKGWFYMGCMFKLLCILILVWTLICSKWFYTSSLFIVVVDYLYGISSLYRRI